MPRALMHVGVDHHADARARAASPRGSSPGRSRPRLRLTMACGDRGRQCRAPPGSPAARPARACVPSDTCRSKRTAAHRMAAPISPAPSWLDCRWRDRARGTRIWPATMPATASRRGIVPSSLPATSGMRFVQARALRRSAAWPLKTARQRFLRQRDAAELRDHRRQVVLPRRRQS